jgi:hypothetical protein
VTTVWIVISALISALVTTALLAAFFPAQRRAFIPIVVCEIVALLAIAARIGNHVGVVLLVPAIVLFALFFGRRRVR